MADPERRCIVKQAIALDPAQKALSFVDEFGSSRSSAT